MNEPTIHRDAMRTKLAIMGLIPTEDLAQEAQDDAGRLRLEVTRAVSKLEPADLFAVWRIVTDLTRKDESFV